ncbi:MAG: flagellar biosynthetic protein FliR [Phycisphaerae bacterium]|nr:flagellar biosynthetic protein FliR [Phycisphaerae bacterium]
MMAETTWILTLLPATCRVAGVALIAPPFGAEVVPVRLRLMFAAVLGVAAVGRLGSPIQPPVDAIAFVGLASLELLLGVTIGLAARLLLSGVQLGATHIAQQIGIGLGDALQPGELDASGPVRRLFTVLAITIFICVGGAESLLGATLRTFQVIPLGGEVPLAGLLGLTIKLLAGSFLLALKVAGPVLAAMLLTAVVFGAVQRTLPSCNLLSVGLPVRVMLGLLVLAAGVTLLPGLIESAWNQAEMVMTSSF